MSFIIRQHQYIVFSTLISAISDKNLQSKNNFSNLMKGFFNYYNRPVWYN
jgi:hypothetical protein